MTTKADRFARLLGNDNMGNKTPEAKASGYAFCDVAPKNMKFVPILAAAKFPYKYMKRTQGETVGIQFFNAGKFYMHKWDLWYIWSPHYHTEKPVVFVPLEQFDSLIKEIDAAYPSFMLSYSDELIFDFSQSDNSELQPRYLGQSSSKEDYDRLINLAPHFGSGHAVDKEDKAIFQSDMEHAVDAGKNKSKAKRQEARALKQQSLSRQLEQTQRYLGLSSSGFDKEVIFIAVDVESYERNHNIITEIGISTLDTRDLRNQSPGDNGKDWFHFIRARHLRIQEYKHYVNSEFVRGCPDAFEFGESEFVSLKDAPRVVASCFKPPFSDPKADSSNSDKQAEEKRNIVFVGHDTKQDIAYLQQLGYDPSNLSNLIDCLDTGAIYRAVFNESQTRGLAHILWELDIEAWNLHNAGNDAAYTMQALLGLCVKDSLKNSTQVIDDNEEGGVSLLATEATPNRKMTNEDWEVLEAAERFEEWQM